MKEYPKQMLSKYLRRVAIATCFGLHQLNDEVAS
jgi:hypothetical protein